MSQITDFWVDSYRKKRGCSYVGFCKRDAIILANLCKEYGEPTVRALIGKFLALEDEPYVRRAGWDTRSFAARARGLYVEHVKKYGEQAVAEANAKRTEVKEIKDVRVLSLLDRIGG